VIGLPITRSTSGGASPGARETSPKPVSMMMTGFRGANRLMLNASSTPFISGIAQSISTTSNQPVWNFLRASCPLVAVSATWPSLRSSSVATSSGTGSSSTTSTRSGRDGRVVSASRAAPPAAARTGSRMMNVVPRPTSLSMSMDPPCRCTMP
jgi:hypothetical protein